MRTFGDKLAFAVGPRNPHTTSTVDTRMHAYITHSMDQRFG